MLNVCFAYRHNGLDARPLGDGGINDQPIKLHLLTD